MGKAAYRTALSRVKLANVWTTTHAATFLKLKKALTSDPMLKAPCFGGTLFVVTLDSFKDGFGSMLTQRFKKTCPGGRKIEKLHPIIFASKCTSPAEVQYQPFLLEFTVLKFCLDKFDDIVWGFLVEIEMDCQALQDVMLSNNLNAMHARCRTVKVFHSKYMDLGPFLYISNIFKIYRNLQLTDI